MTDVRSPLAASIIGDNPDAYQSLVVQGDTPDMAHQLLDGVEPAQLMAAPAASSQAADEMLAGLWVWHDGLAEAHQIAMKLTSPTGSFWHASMQYSFTPQFYSNNRSRKNVCTVFLH
jgi:hypothetical protein